MPFTKGHQINIGRYFSIERNRKISIKKKGQKHSKKTKNKMSLAKKGSKGYWTGKKFSKEYKEKLSIAHTNKPMLKTRGKNHWNWKGTTAINLSIRSSLEYKIWRKAVFERDSYTCIWCGLKSGNGKTVILNADHIKPFAYFPELRFAIDNGRTLCIDCHKTTDTWGRPAKVKNSLNGT